MVNTSAICGVTKRQWTITSQLTLHGTHLAMHVPHHCQPRRLHDVDVHLAKQAWCQQTRQLTKGSKALTMLGIFRNMGIVLLRTSTQLLYDSNRPFCAYRPHTE